jgi:hypothetical protein
VLSGAVIHRRLRRWPRSTPQGDIPPSTELQYGGGTGGIGVEAALKIYLVVYLQ